MCGGRNEILQTNGLEGVAWILGRWELEEVD